MTRQSPFLRVNAPWMRPKTRPPLTGTRDRRPDPAQAELQSTLINSFDEVPQAPWSHVGISIAIPDMWDPHAAGVMKLVIDAVVTAGFIEDDRNEIEIVRLSKYTSTGVSQPSLNVRVLERKAGDGCFVRQYWPNPDPEPGSGAHGGAVPYTYVSGTPDEASFSRGRGTPDDYVNELRTEWQELQDQGAIEIDEDWATFLSGGWELHLYVPSRGNFDPDNVLLYVLDLLEVARRDALAGDAGDLTVDQHVNEILLARHDSDGIMVEAYTCGQHTDECLLPYFGVDI